MTIMNTVWKRLAPVASATSLTSNGEKNKSHSVKRENNLLNSISDSFVFISLYFDMKNSARFSHSNRRLFSLKWRSQSFTGFLFCINGTAKLEYPRHSTSVSKCWRCSINDSWLKIVGTISLINPDFRLFLSIWNLCFILNFNLKIKSPSTFNDQLKIN